MNTTNFVTHAGGTNSEKISAIQPSTLNSQLSTLNPCLRGDSLSPTPGTDASGSDVSTAIRGRAARLRIAADGCGGVLMSRQQHAHANVIQLLFFSLFLRVPGVLRGDPLSPTPGAHASGSEVQARTPCGFFEPQRASRTPRRNSRMRKRSTLDSGLWTLDSDASGSEDV
jgi:hypothetical protein